jgi:hypothetical protein
MTLADEPEPWRVDARERGAAKLDPIRLPPQTSDLRAAGGLIPPLTSLAIA